MMAGSSTERNIYVFEPAAVTFRGGSPQLAYGDACQKQDAPFRLTPVALRASSSSSLGAFEVFSSSALDWSSTSSIPKVDRRVLCAFSKTILKERA